MREVNHMRKLIVFVVSLLVVAVALFGQNDLVTFKKEVSSAFVWGQDSPGGAISSITQDPLTGDSIPTLSYAGIGVSSRMGFERVGRGRVGDFLGYSTTIVNNTSSIISVSYGGISVDGHAAPPLSVAPSENHLSKRDVEKRTNVVGLGTLHCFTTGFLSGENFFSANHSSERFTVDHGTAVTISSVIKDPRNYGVRCSVAGCYPTGTIRYFVTVNSQDYVFMWPGRSIAYCGK
jgi:hypothetical protein